MKKIIMLLVIMSLILITGVPAFAATDYESEAKELKDMGLFKGSELGFELNRAPSRVEAGVMLVRLLGKEEEAVSEANTHPFSDVPSWANSYIGYLYANGLSKGVSKTIYGSQDLIDAKSYTTFVLRALGYNDDNGDFSWSKSIDKALAIGLLSENERSDIDSTQFLRGHMVDISYNALSTKIKNSENALVEKFAQDGALTRISYKAIETGAPIWHFTIDRETLPESMKNYAYFNMGGGNFGDLNNVAVYSRTLTSYFDEINLKTEESETSDIGIYKGYRHDLILLDGNKEPIGYAQFEYPDPNKTELYVSFKEYTKPELPYEIKGALSISDSTIISINEGLIPDYKYAIVAEGSFFDPADFSREGMIMNVYARLMNNKSESRDMEIGINKTFDLKDSNDLKDFGQKGYYGMVCVFFFDGNNEAIVYAATEENYLFEWEY